MGKIVNTEASNYISYFMSFVSAAKYGMYVHSIQSYSKT
jgi:hypothetical protein